MAAGAWPGPRFLGSWGFLAESISGCRAEAADLIGSPVDRIELTPNDQGRLDILGDLAGNLGKPARRVFDRRSLVSEQRLDTEDTETTESADGARKSRAPACPPRRRSRKRFGARSTPTTRLRKPRRRPRPSMVRGTQTSGMPRDMREAQQTFLCDLCVSSALSVSKSTNGARRVGGAIRHGGLK